MQLQEYIDFLDEFLGITAQIVGCSALLSYIYYTDFMKKTKIKTPIPITKWVFYCRD